MSLRQHDIERGTGEGARQAELRRDCGQLSGYDLARRVLDHPRGGVAAMIRLAAGDETDWLEFKAAMLGRPEDRKPGENNVDGYWHVAEAVIALANSRGGAVLVGVDDKTHCAIGLHACDPRGIIAQHGLEAYRRQEILDRVDPANGTWATGTRGIWRIGSGRLPEGLVEVRAARYQEQDVAVILVRPAEGKCIRIWNGQVEQVLRRRLGNVGKTEALVGSEAMESYDRERRVCGDDLADSWQRFSAKRNVRIFISSPGDVQEERQKARDVIGRLSRSYAGSITISPVFWEDLPLPATASLQEGIDLVIGDRHGIDIAVFVLWSRLGSRLGSAILRRDGGEYRSGTEREFDLMMRAREASGNQRPEILVYLRSDDATFNDSLDRASPDARSELLEQRKMLESFIQTEFREASTGANTRAYLSFRSPLGFAEALHNHLKAKLQELLEETVEENTWEGNPYLGLSPFRPEHAEVFFGREEDTSRFLEKMQCMAVAPRHFILVCGPSGAGKSSFVQAGVVPRLSGDRPEGLRADWRYLIFTPSQTGGDLPKHFCSLLAREGCLPQVLRNVTMDDLVQSARRDLQSVIDLNLKGLAKELSSSNGLPPKILVVVDQLEELFSSYIPEATASFVSFLDTLAQSDLFFVVATMRNDFYHRYQESRELVALKGELGLFDLQPPETDDFARITAIPARMAGYKFETDSTAGRLDRQITRDLDLDGNALPLLEYVLAELVESAGENRLLTFANYREMGGLHGAIGKRAEEVYTRHSDKGVFSQVFQALVSVDEGNPDKAIRTKAPMAVICGTPEGRAIVDGFVQTRLLTVDGDTVTVAHEALFTQWDRFRLWIAENRRALAFRKVVEDSYQRWERNGRNKDYLIRGSRPVADARYLLEHHAELLNHGQAQYIKSSIRREGFGRRIWKVTACVLAITSVTMFIATAYAVKQARRANDLARKSEQETALLTENILPLMYHVNINSADFEMRGLANDFLAECRGVFMPDYYPDSFLKSYQAAMMCQMLVSSVAARHSIAFLNGMSLTEEGKRELAEALAYANRMGEILAKLVRRSDVDSGLSEMEVSMEDFEISATEAMLAKGGCQLRLGNYGTAIDLAMRFAAGMEAWIPSSDLMKNVREHNLFEAYTTLAHAYRLSNQEEQAKAMMVKSLEHGELMCAGDPNKKEIVLLRYAFTEWLGMADDRVQTRRRAFCQELGVAEPDFAELVTALDSSLTPAFVITAIAEESAAARAGVQVGDIILEWGQRKYFSQAFPNGDKGLLNAFDSSKDVIRSVLVYRDTEVLHLGVPPTAFGATIGQEVIDGKLQMKEAYERYTVVP